jgi:hypothetical protein
MQWILSPPPNHSEAGVRIHNEIDRGASGERLSDFPASFKPHVRSENAIDVMSGFLSSYSWPFTESTNAVNSLSVLRTSWWERRAQSRHDPVCVSEPDGPLDRTNWGISCTAQPPIAGTNDKF